MSGSEAVCIDALHFSFELQICMLLTDMGICMLVLASEKGCRHIACVPDGPLAADTQECNEQAVREPVVCR